MYNESKHYKGTCTMCGAEDCELTIVDEVELRYLGNPSKMSWDKVGK